MSMFDVSRVSVDVGESEISFETGKLAKQASGAVVVRAGETMGLCTATAGNPRDVDFLPLTVDVEERMYAAGKIPGSFFKREGRPSEKGILTARMIDRPIRPLFPKGWSNETQVVATPMCIDHVNTYDILAMNGASAALAVSDIPFPAQMGAVRIGKLEGKFVVNPGEADLPESELELIVAGTDDAIMMVEAGATEVTEAEILDALDIAHQEIRKLCAAQRELAEKIGKQKMTIEPPAVEQELYEQIQASHGAELDRVTQIEDKLERRDSTKAVGEAGFMRGPKRRDIGHGALAERALLPMIPPQEDFPYTIRVVSDILESNGSSSMASVCGSTLSLMDAGVKIHKPVAGIAMGLIMEGDDFVVLSDIAGVEDHLGDMDFKIAGTHDGITALQMDIKISGVTFDILRTALEQAREGRLFILDKMQQTISETRAE